MKIKDKIPYLFLKATTLVLGVAMAAWVIFAVPTIAKDAFRFVSEVKFVVYLFLIGMYGAVIPFYYALYQGLVFLNLSEKGQSYSAKSLKSLLGLKYASLLVSIFYLLFTMLFFYAVAEKDDAPGLILVGGAFGAAPLVFAALAEVFGKILIGKKSK